MNLIKATYEEIPEEFLLSCRTLLGICPLALLETAGPEHTIVYINPILESKLDKRNDMVVGNTFDKVMPVCVDDVDLKSMLDRVYQTGKPECQNECAHRDEAGRDYYWTYYVWKIRSRDGSSKGLFVHISNSTASAQFRRMGDVNAQIVHINQELVLAAIRQLQMAELINQSQQEILLETEMNTSIMSREAVLAERSRIAQELHDTLLQTFSGILMQLRVAQRMRWQHPEMTWELIDRCVDVAAQGLADARKAIWLLQPDSGEHRDLSSSIKDVISNLSFLNHSQIHFNEVGDRYLCSPDVVRDLTRIASEAIVNAVKHAESDNINIKIIYLPDSIQLSVSDDGKGFDTERCLEGGGFGITSMKQRVQRMNGTLLIKSDAGKGTEITVRIPSVNTLSREK